jgi:hypothetical protein
MPNPNPARTRRDVLDVDPRELRDSLHVRVDRELIDELDRQRGSVSRSEYLEMVLGAALSRPAPHLPDDWTPERAAEQRYERLQRYLTTGH